MKKVIKICLIVTLYLIIGSDFAIAHPGGHYHKEDEFSLRTWVYKLNGKPLKGNFSFFKNGTVYVEMLNGAYTAIALSSLKGKDREYVEKEILEISDINTFSTKIPLPKHKETNMIFIFYLLLLTVVGVIAIMLLYLIGTVIYFDSKCNSKWMISYCIGLTGFCCAVVACKKSVGSNSTIFINKTETTFLDSMFSPFKSSVTTRFDSNYYYVSSNGLAVNEENMMVGITSWQQQVPIPQPYNGSNSWSIPLQPEFATTPLSLKSNLMMGAVAIAANGIPIFNALNNRGDDAFIFGELDNWGGAFWKGR